jgi:alkyl sulfatase BDS1-like metallo-beta-lactamase superfamily hydrolase
MSSVNHREHLNDLPFADTADFADTDRGFIAALEPSSSSPHPKI